MLARIFLEPPSDLNPVRPFSPWFVWGGVATLKAKLLVMSLRQKPMFFYTAEMIGDVVHQRSNLFTSFAGPFRAFKDGETFKINEMQYRKMPDKEVLAIIEDGKTYKSMPDWYIP